MAPELVEVTFPIVIRFLTSSAPPLTEFHRPHDIFIICVVGLSCEVGLLWVFYYFPYVKNIYRKIVKSTPQPTAYSFNPPHQHLVKIIIDNFVIIFSEIATCGR